MKYSNVKFKQRWQQNRLLTVSRSTTTHKIEKGLTEAVKQNKKISDSPHLYSLKFPRRGWNKNFNCIKIRPFK